MKELLQEFLTDLLLEKKPAQKKEITAADQAKQMGLVSMGFGRWGKDGVVTHNSVKDPATGKTKLVAKAGAAPAAPAPTKRGKQPQPVAAKAPAKRTAKAPVADKPGLKPDEVFAKKISSTRKEHAKTSLLALSVALEKGSASDLQKVINTLELTVSKEGKLKAKKFRGDDQKIAGDDTDFARHVYGLAKNMGVEIPGGPPPEKSAPTTSKTSEQFKPSSLFRSTAAFGKLDVQVTDNGGVVVEGTQIDQIKEEEVVKQEEHWVQQAAKFKADKGEEFTSEYEENVRRYIRGVCAKNNHNVNYIRRLAESGADLRTFEFKGEEGLNTITTALTDAITQNVPDEQKRTEILGTLDQMKNSKNALEFNKAFANFSVAIKGTPIASSKKYIVESLTAMRTIIKGGIAIIPDSDSFQLADVVNIRTHPLTGNLTVEQFIVDVEEEQTVSAAGSVKEGKGNASGNRPKIENSEFDTGEVDGVDCSSVQQDLLELCGMRNQIFTATPDGKTSPEAKGKLLKTISKYSPMIKAYYGLDESVSDDELYEFLSYGKELACVDGKPSPTEPDAKGGKSQPYGQANRPNGDQWRSWSVLGKVTDAIHNRTVRFQFYDTIRYNGDVTTADGIRRLSKMESQHLKNEAKLSGGDGFTRPDQELNAFTKPATIAETRNGNPCKKGKK